MSRRRPGHATVIRPVCPVLGSNRSNIQARANKSSGNSATSTSHAVAANAGHEPPARLEGEPADGRGNTEAGIRIRT